MTAAAELREAIKFCSLVELADPASAAAIVTKAARFRLRILEGDAAIKGEKK